MAQVSPSSANKLANCLTVSELDDLGESVSIMCDFPDNLQDLLFEVEQYYSEGDPEP